MKYITDFAKLVMNQLKKEHKHMNEYNIIYSNIEHVSEQIINNFNDMIRIFLTHDKIFLENDENIELIKENKGIYCFLCTCIPHEFWKHCIEYKKNSLEIMEQTIKEDKKEDAKRYIIKAIKEIIKINNERSN